MRQVITAAMLMVFLAPSASVAMDVSEIGLVTGHLRLGLSGGDRFGDTIGHELEEEYSERMKQLDNKLGMGGSLSYRRGISPSILFGFSFDYFRSAEMEGEGVDDVVESDSTFSSGSYALYGVSLNLQPGMSLTEELMIFAEFGLGGYGVQLEGNTESLNAAVNLGAVVDYFLSESMGLELSVRKPFFLSDFVFIEEHYTLDPSPVQFMLGVSWLLQ